MVFTGTTVGMAQEELANESNSTNSNRQDQSVSQINKNNSPVFSISKDDFLNVTVIGSLTYMNKNKV